jgi:hypothetical protein
MKELIVNEISLIYTGVRHGQSAQVQNTMLEFNKDGKPVWDFKGKNILKGIFIYVCMYMYIIVNILNKLCI